MQTSSRFTHLRFESIQSAIRTATVVSEGLSCSSWNACTLQKSICDEKFNHQEWTGYEDVIIIVALQVDGAAKTVI
jgi:hypothetical protein